MYREAKDVCYVFNNGLFTLETNLRGLITSNKFALTRCIIQGLAQAIMH